MCTGQVSSTDPSAIKSFQRDPLRQKDLGNGGLNGLNPQKRMQFQYKFRHFSVKQPGFEAMKTEDLSQTRKAIHQHHPQDGDPIH